MAVLTLYLKEVAASGSNHLSLQDGGTPPTTAIMTTGWIVGTLTATRYARMDSQTERASSVHLTTPVEPSGVPDNTLGDCFRTENTYTGNFAAGNWVLTIPVRGETRATSTHDGRLRIRIWRSTSQTGSGATELTGAVLVTTAYTDLSNSTAQSLTVTWTASAFSVSGEYLFVQVAHELTGAGSNANSDTHFMSGTSNVATTDFTNTAQNHTSTQTDPLGSVDSVGSVVSASVSTTDSLGVLDVVEQDFTSGGGTQHEVTVRRRVVVT